MYRWILIAMMTSANAAHVVSDPYPQTQTQATGFLIYCTAGPISAQWFPIAPLLDVNNEPYFSLDVTGWTQAQISACRLEAFADIPNLGRIYSSIENFPGPQAIPAMPTGLRVTTQ